MRVKFRCINCGHTWEGQRAKVRPVCPHCGGPVLSGQFWLCDDCKFKRVSQLAVIAHVEATGHTVRKGTSYIRPRRAEPRRVEVLQPPQRPSRRPRYEPSRPVVGRKLMVSLFIITALMTTAPVWFPWARAQYSIWTAPPGPKQPSVCTPSVVSFAQIYGPHFPALELNGSAFQTGPDTGGVADKRALQQPCTITNVRGEKVGTLVQVKKVKLLVYGVATYDCDTSFTPVNGGRSYPDGQVFCDFVGDIYENAYLGNRSEGFIHIEIDRDWQAAGACGVNTACDNFGLEAYRSNYTRTVLLDMQGYVYWDDDGKFELHALTSWSLAA